jgi:hypothetical protein
MKPFSYLFSNSVTNQRAIFGNTRKVRRVAGMVALLWIFASGLVAQARIIYVNGDRGQDTTGDGSAARPYRTANKAHRMAVVGDVLRFTATEYSEVPILSKPVRLTSAGGLVKLKGRPDDWIISDPPKPPHNSPPVISMPVALEVLGTPWGNSGLDACADLTASVTDDGLPSPPGRVKVEWNKASGPAAVNFSDPYSRNTRACFTTIGKYELHLTADDGDHWTGGLKSTSRLTVTVDKFARHYLRTTSVPGNCGIQGYALALENTHPTRTSEAKLRVSYSMGGQLPVWDATLISLRLAPGEVRKLPCNVTAIEVLDATYVNSALTMAGAGVSELDGEKSSLGGTRLSVVRPVDAGAAVIQDGVIHLELSGAMRGECEIQVSDDLILWSTLTHLPAAEQPIQIMDVLPVGSTTRFYRVVEVLPQNHDEELRFE